MAPLIDAMSSDELKQNEKYVVDEDAALVILNEMYAKICCEDQTLRTFRRSLSFGHYIKRTLIPLLMSTKREPIIELTMRLLANLTLPVECLYAAEIMARTETGRKNIAEIGAMLMVTKRSFANMQANRAIVDYLRGILEKDTRISPENCGNINNCLIVLRNVLHVPARDRPWAEPQWWPESAALQNQIMYNLFALSIDKLLIHLMSCAQREYFGVAMVQLIALMFKDQPNSALQTSLASWFDASMSDSSEDFESNTTPVKATSGNSSPMLTSDSSSEHSGGNMAGESKSTASEEEAVVVKTQKKKDAKDVKHKAADLDESGVIDYIDVGSRKNSLSSYSASSASASESRKKSMFSELSDCGYGTQVESSAGRPEVALNTSSNEDEQPQPFHQHQKPPATNQKQRYNAKNNPRSAIARNDKKEWRRKKLVKRSKMNLITMNGALHHGPSDAAISNILKEFTVDFLLKCYGYLVKGLHMQLLTQTEPASDIDTSHFLWLISYFLKLTAKLEFELEHVKHVLSLGIISYLTYEGVSLSEELTLLLAQEDADTRSVLRRLHLVVTAIQEYLQTLDSFKRIGLLSVEDKSHLHELTLQISELTGLQCLFVMLLRNFNTNIHAKQYLQDVIVTNHVLLVLLDEASKYDDYRGSVKMQDHIEQFATVEVMQQYGLLLTDYQQNGEFVNDCIFTMMHHIGGDIGQVALLFQPNILKAFSQIFETEYDLCDDWSDLIEYIIHKFLNTPQQSALAMPRFSLADPTLTDLSGTVEKRILSNAWTKEETDSLYWYYVHSRTNDDLIGAITKLYAMNDLRIKSRIAVIQQLLLQDIITLPEYDDLMALEDVSATESMVKSPYSIATDESGALLLSVSGKVCIKGTLDELLTENDAYQGDDETGAEKTLVCDDIEMLKQRILSDGKGKSLQWLQKTLIDCCHVKLVSKRRQRLDGMSGWNTSTWGAVEPIPLHYLLKGQAIPVVPWNKEQSVVHLYPPFMLLLHKLGFQLPADSGKAFIRIPAFWTADIMFNVAEKLGPMDKSIFRFDLDELHDPPTLVSDARHLKCAKDTKYGLHQRLSMIRFTPDPLTQYASTRCGYKHVFAAADIVDCATTAVTSTGAASVGARTSKTYRRRSEAALHAATQPTQPDRSASAAARHARRSNSIPSHSRASASAADNVLSAVVLAAACKAEKYKHSVKASALTIPPFKSKLPPDGDAPLHEQPSAASPGLSGGSILDRFPPAAPRRLPVVQESVDEEDEADAFAAGGALMLRRLSPSLGLNVCDTASVVSDSTHIYDLYVSDGEDP